MAEIVSVILEFASCIAPPTCRYLDYYRKFGQGMDELRREVEALNSRKEDIQRRLDAEVCSERVISKQVEEWLKDVQRVNDEMKDIEEKVPQVSGLSRARLGKLVRRQVKAVKEIQQRNFPEGLVIDGPPTIGTTLLTDGLKGEQVAMKEKIWEYLMGNEVRMIGVWGIGGVGKTTIMTHINNELLELIKKNNNNELLEAPCRFFDKVIWVTVSQSFNVLRIQDEIANKMKKHLPDGEDELQRASRLMEFMGNMKFVLILDDVWNKFSLEHVGILRPTVENGCKILVTSRSSDVCVYVGCEVVKVPPLTEQESLNLFLDKVELNILQIPQNLKEVLISLVKEWAGLPLALVVIARSMRGVGDDIREWRTALCELREHVKGTNEETEDKIFERLKFSYNRLRDPNMQNCFLSCSLYPEDWGIHRSELIEYWMDFGLIEELSSRQAMCDKGHSILNMLVKNCLLENAGEQHVKMHDVVRDMALWITKNNPRFMVKAGVQLTEIPDESKWTGDLQKASLMRNKISKIPQNFSPKCPRLSTLMLQENTGLSQIPESFFANMPGLKILDLSSTNVRALPNSICNLENLTSLVLRYCRALAHVPSLARLKALNKLDLCHAGIRTVPEGIEMLVNLSYLDLSCENLEALPEAIFNNLSRLQYLAVHRKSSLKIRGEKAARLTRLETFQGQFYDLVDFKNYVQSENFGRLRGGYWFSVGPDPEAMLHLSHCRWHRSVNLGECNIKAKDSVVLPDDLQFLRIYRCNDVRSFSDISTFLQNTTELNACSIEECQGIECMVDMVSSPTSCFINFPEYLYLDDLCNLRVLVKMEGATTVSTLHAPIPHGFFSRLKTFHIYRCLKMKKLFPYELLQNLQNLEALSVINCDQMEEIIVSEEDEENHTIKFTLPKLVFLCLELLPELKRICTRRGVMVCDSFKSISICGCPKLKRIPLLGIEQLERISIGSWRWWESLEWDNPDHKNVLRPLVQSYGP